MIYVFSNYKAIEDKIYDCEINRLFAYPTVPTLIHDKSLYILDSGGFAMSQKNKKIDTNYMIELSKYYEEYNKDNVICVAPDKWLDAVESMRLYQKWHKLNLFKDITPVLQDKKKGVVDVEYMKRQVDFYKGKSNKIMYSNNGIRGDSHMAMRVEKVCRYVKEQGFEWIHLLGAGWDLDDIKAWKSSKYIDSMDSIAYYTSPKEFKANIVLEAIHNILSLFE